MASKDAFAALPGPMSTPNANGVGCEIDDDRDMRPMLLDNEGGIVCGCPGMTGCVGEWYDALVGEYARLVESANETAECSSGGNPVAVVPATECPWRETVGRDSDHDIPGRVELEEKDVEASGAGALAGPAGRDAKSAGGYAS